MRLPVAGLIEFAESSWHVGGAAAKAVLLKGLAFFVE